MATRRQRFDTREIARVLSRHLSYHDRATIAAFVDTATAGHLAEVAHHMRVELEREGRNKTTGEAFTPST